MKGQRILIVGAGASGVAAARLASRFGALVTVSEIKPQAQWADTADALERNGIKVEGGGHQPLSFEHADLIVVSPGVPKEHPLVQHAMDRKVACVSEIEFAYRLLPQGVRIIGITGTKGKTTTTMLVGTMIREAGLPVVVAGNMGTPLSAEIERLLPSHILVLELSSFQLELIERFHPQVAAVLNISEDHLDRHPSMQGYIEAKLNIFKNQTAGDVSILNLGNRYTPLLQEATRADIVMFGGERKPDRGAWVDHGVLTTNLVTGHPIGLVSEQDLLIRGPHNVENALAAVVASSFVGVPAAVMASVLKSFKGVPHRQEHVGVVEGVQFVNNSQGTNIEAVAKSLQSYDHPIILIAGGRKKAGRFEDLNPLLKTRVKSAVLIGEAAGEMEEAWKAVIPVSRSSSLESAVEQAFRSADPGDIVMLSPACASFDMFKNYEERGERFRKAVRALAPIRRDSTSGTSSGGFCRMSSSFKVEAR